ncbi:hypothetical protein BDZ45DRAFT_690604 [Acephala macrosclerotiorum]|nr:hypothetical protein BDZ45DRAFT_690604 [Acephala macrosclerotiorum]
MKKDVVERRLDWRVVILYSNDIEKIEGPLRGVTKDDLEEEQIGFEISELQEERTLSCTILVAAFDAIFCGLNCFAAFWVARDVGIARTKQAHKDDEVQRFEKSMKAETAWTGALEKGFERKLEERLEILKVEWKARYEALDWRKWRVVKAALLEYRERAHEVYQRRMLKQEGLELEIQGLADKLRVKAKREEGEE